MIQSFRDISTAAVVTAVTLSVATMYIILGSSILPKHSKRKLRGPRGLVNPQRSCYMNAVLQAFASSETIQNWLRQSRPSPLKQGLLKCLCVVNRSEDDPNEEIMPTYLYSALRSLGYSLSGDEQDAHELFQGLLDAIESDNETFKEQYDPGSLFDAVEGSSRLSGILSKHGEAVFSRPMSALEDISPFSGTITSRVKKKENASPTRSTLFNSVTLYLPRPNSVLYKYGCPITLESLLHNFIEVEAVEESTKQQAFARLPQCLCLHIQRTGFDSGMAFKREDRVIFPLQLNMDQFVYVRQLKSKTPNTGCSIARSQSMDFPKRKHNYQLCAVLCHFGEIQSGHYITYRRHLDHWYFTSDADVRRCQTSEVLASNPYILFYEKLLQPPRLKEV